MSYEPEPLGLFTGVFGFLIFSFISHFWATVFLGVFCIAIAAPLRHFGKDRTPPTTSTADRETLKAWLFDVTYKSYQKEPSK